jgi:large subunit ribosomal protein L32
MPVPKRKRSRARRDKRFANKGFSVQPISACANCKMPLLSHEACLGCGFYKGKKVISVKLDRSIKRLEKRQKKQDGRQQENRKVASE